MKRRKIVGMVLLIGTICYLLASLLALYQNQRVKMEKGIEEALKAYSDRESLNVKELSKDFNLMLDEKLDISDMNKQIMKYEGSFATIEKSINNVANEMTRVDYNFNHVNERLNNMENFYNIFYEEVMNMNSAYENQIVNNTNSIAEIKKEMEAMQDGISKNQNNIIRIDERYIQSEQKQQEDIYMIQEQIALCEQRIADLESNTLHYRYDSETQTLNVFGKRENVAE